MSAGAESAAMPGAHDACLCFELAGQPFAVAIAVVREVMPGLEVTPVPGAPGCVLGVGAVRGRIVPVVDAGRLLGLGPVVASAVGGVVLLGGQRERDAGIACVVGAIAGLRPRAAVLADGTRWLDVAAVAAALASAHAPAPATAAPPPRAATVCEPAVREPT